jgi:hypothetical protein
MIEAQVVGGTIAALAVAGMAFTRMLFKHGGKMASRGSQQRERPPGVNPRITTPHRY